MKTCKQNQFYGGNVMGYVITNDGIRMSYAEYMEMIKAERN